MIITETLAKGLMHRFFDEAHDLINKCVDQLIAAADSCKESKTGWAKYLQRIDKVLSKVAISRYEGGSKNNPYLAFVGLSLDRSRNFNSWNERCLTGESVIHVQKPMFLDTFDACFNVGEHAVSRIYERGKLRFTDEFTVDLYSILPEFQMLPLWSAFWISNIGVLTHAFSEHFLPHFYHPVVPAKSGLLLGELTHVKVPKVEIRTFVDDKNLSEDQRKLRDVMWSLGEFYKSSPLAMFQLTGKIESDYYVNMALLSDLADYADLLTKVVFKTAGGTQLDAKAIESFREYFKSAKTERGALMSKVFREIGIRETQLLIKKDQLKHN